MPYNKRKQKCKQSDGTPGKYVLSYTDKKGKKHKACHTSQKKMQGQIAAIEGPREDDTPEGEGLNELRAVIRDLLKEEIVSVARSGKPDQTYNIEFSEDGSIVSGQVVNMNDYPDELEAMKAVAKYTTLPKGSLLAFILDLKERNPPVPVQQKLTSIDQAVSEMNANWISTIQWPQKGRVGRGEASMHLAFKASPTAKEPDFVSEDGSIKLSIKYFGGNGSLTAKTGEASEKVKDLVSELSTALGGVAFPQTSWGEKGLATALAAIPAKERQAVIDKATDIIDQIRATILSEHEAAGILGLDDSEFYFIPNSSPKSDDPRARGVTPVYVKNSGTRVEFGGPKRPSTSTNLYNGLVTAQKALDVELEEIAAAEKAAAEKAAAGEAATGEEVTPDSQPELQQDGLTRRVVRSILKEDLTGSDKAEIRRMIKKELGGPENRRSVDKAFKKHFDKELRKALGSSFFGTPGKINKFVVDEIHKEVTKSLGSQTNKDVIVFVCKEVIKKLYRELSFSSPQIIDRINPKV